MLDSDFKKLKKIAGHLRKVRPQDSVGKIYLNRKESQIIRKYEKEKADFLMKTREKNFANIKQNFISSIDNLNVNASQTTNKNFKMPFSIDRKILRKIAYV